MTNTHSNIFIKLLAAIAWPTNGKIHPKTIQTSQNTFCVKFLHALIYSEHQLNIKPVSLADLDPKFAAEIKRISKLWDRAYEAMRSNRLIAARNALNLIISIDPYNAAAYNRLGIIYAKQKKYTASITNFRTAVKLESTASSNHNLGLIYYEVGDYKHSLKYFKKALKLENSFAPRHVAIAKVYEKLGNDKLLFHHLAQAVKLEPTIEVMKLLYKAYIAHNMSTEAEALEKQMKASVKRIEREINEIESAPSTPNRLFKGEELEYAYIN